jgi:hypothetical protein
MHTSLAPQHVGGKCSAPQPVLLGCIATRVCLQQPGAPRVANCRASRPVLLYCLVTLQHACSKAQTDAIVSARSSLLSELHRVAADWQRVLPTLALQLLQVPRVQWHTVAAVQAMVNNLAAEREAVVGFLHTLIDEVRQVARD